MSKLAKEFLRQHSDYFLDFLSEKEFEIFKKGVFEARNTSLRFSLPASVSHDNERQAKLGLNMIPIPWAPNVFTVPTMKRYNDEEKRLKLTSSPLYLDGKFTLQSASSCLPVQFLPIEKGSLVLDMAAAPGSKTVQILEKLNGTGHLIANDISQVRLARLDQNVKRMLPTNMYKSNLQVLCSDATRRNKAFINRFDAILLDAPCSGEGLFNITNIKSFDQWSYESVERNVSIQRSLMARAVEYLKPGGYLLYSTCTLNPYENEEQVAFVLENFKSMQLMQLSIQIETLPTSILESNDQVFLPGISFGSFDLSKCIRILPSCIYEGFFVSLLKKSL